MRVLLVRGRAAAVEVRMRLQGKTVLVTGAGSGIGEAVARRFVAEVGGERAVALAQERFGGLHGGVSAAGIIPSGNDDEAFRETLVINTMGPAVTADVAIPAIAASGGGSFVIVGSIVAYFSFAPDSIPYATSKGGLQTLTHVLAVEHGPRGVRVNCVNPGLVDTPMIAPFVDYLARKAGVSHDEALALMSRDLPLKRIGRPAELASACLFLVSDEASFVPGAILDVDGGTTSVNPGMMGYHTALRAARGER